MRNPEGRVAVVTGTRFGVGRGLRAALFVTGRSADEAVFDTEQITTIRCDHRVDGEVTAVFELVKRETGGVDILVNKVWGGYEKMVQDGVFTWVKPFWGRTVWRLDAMLSAGVRAHYYGSQLAAKSMVSSRRGLILNIMSREMMFQVPCSCLGFFPILFGWREASLAQQERWNIPRRQCVV